MDLLFRPVFTRVKTPVIGSAPDRQSSFSTDDNNDSEESVSMNNRIRPTSRVSSYMGFRPSTPPIPAPDTFPNLRNPDNVYHKPSGDQLAEMLQVVMMNQSTMDHVPIAYNSTILHVLEAYQDLKTQLIAKEEAIEVLKQSHTKDIKDFEELAWQWQQKESDYKGEVKKLEVLLSKMEGGLESVAMARSKSVVHGAERASDSLKRGIGTIKARNAARNRQDAGIDSPDFGIAQKSVKCMSSFANFELIANTATARKSFQVCDDRDSSTSASFEPPSQHLPRKRNTIDTHPRRERSQFCGGSLNLYDSPELHTAKASLQGSDYQPQSLTKAQLEALERQQAQECGIAFESSVSGADSSSLSHHSDFPTAHGRQPLGLGILEKPLPKIPVSAKERGKQSTLDKFLNAGQHSYSDPNTAATPVKNAANYDMGFSFQLGEDEEELLTRRADRDRAQRRTIDEHLDHRTSLPDLTNSGSNTLSKAQGPTHRPRQATRLGVKSKPSASGLSAIAKPSQLPRVQHDHDQLTRVDSSSSSIVTAVRNNSGRSSANNSQVGRPKLNRNTATSGSSEAVSAATAAARAYAAGNKRPSIDGSRRGSGSGEARKESKGQEGEGSKSLIGSGATSVRSMKSTSSISGSEAGKGKKIVGGVRITEKS